MNAYKRGALLASSLALVALGATACPSSASRPGGAATPNAKISCPPGDDNYSWCANNPQNQPSPESKPESKPKPSAVVVTTQARPMPSADAQEPGNFPIPVFPTECDLYLRHAPTGITMWDTLHLRGSVQLVCRVMPTAISVTLRLEYFYHGVWIDETAPEVDSFPPTLNSDGGFRRDYSIEATCYTGRWRLEVTWTGIKSDGHTGMPNPADGDPPGHRIADVYKATC
jgi:hypothetical protein